MHAGLRILQHPRCSILVSQSSTAASKNKANACGLDTIGVLIKEPQTMGREISRGGGLGHWHSDTIPFSFAALCFLGPLAFPLPLWRNLCACPCWVSKVTLQEISIYLHKQEAKKKKGGFRLSLSQLSSAAVFLLISNQFFMVFFPGITAKLVF